MCFDLTHAPVATSARAAATGLVSLSTRPDPEGSGTVEIATRRCPRLRVVWEGVHNPESVVYFLYMIHKRVVLVLVHTLTILVGFDTYLVMVLPSMTLKCR